MTMTPAAPPPRLGPIPPGQGGSGRRRIERAVSGRATPGPPPLAPAWRDPSNGGRRHVRPDRQLREQPLGLAGGRAACRRTLDAQAACALIGAFAVEPRATISGSKKSSSAEIAARRVHLFDPPANRSVRNTRLSLCIPTPFRVRHRGARGAPRSRLGVDSCVTFSGWVAPGRCPRHGVIWKIGHPIRVRHRS
jgi:hypothetical protein